MADIGICECKLCDCAVTVDDKYCSDHCREVTEQGINEIKCDCGCPACQ